MTDIVKRGFVPTDEKEFDSQNIKLLKKAKDDICILINREYKLDNAVEFVGNHYRLSARQRLSLKRVISTDKDIELRLNHRIVSFPQSSIVNIDGLNLIITLEVALSGCTLLKCMDSTIRDLAGLRGTYRLIDKTDLALLLIFAELKKMQVSKAIFYLDSPVSNTGRLKQRIFELYNNNNYNFNVEVNLVPNADVVLEKLENVVTTDGIILNKCTSWLNISANIIENNIEDLSIVNFLE